MSDNEWVPVNVRVLREAFEELVPLDETSATRTVDVSKKFLRELISELEEMDLVCDHSVGICACGARDVHELLSLALDGKQRCPRCGGDGVVAVDYDNSERCDRCKGTGAVAFTAERS